MELLELGDHLDEEGEGDEIKVRTTLIFLAQLIVQMVVVQLKTFMFWWKDLYVCGLIFYFYFFPLVEMMRYENGDCHCEKG